MPNPVPLPTNLVGMTKVMSSTTSNGSLISRAYPTTSSPDFSALKSGAFVLMPISRRKQSFANTYVPAVMICGNLRPVPTEPGIEKVDLTAVDKAPARPDFIQSTASSKDVGIGVAFKTWTYVTAAVKLDPPQDGQDVVPDTGSGATIAVTARVHHKSQKSQWPR